MVLREFEFGGQVDQSKSKAVYNKLFLKGVWSGSRDPFFKKILGPSYLWNG